MKTLHTALLAALLSTAALAQAADTPAAPDMSAMQGMHQMHGMDRGHHDGAGLARMINNIPDVTPEQKTRLQAIAKAAAADLKPLHEKMRAAHEESRKLLTAPTVDRAAIERARAEQASLHDAISKRMTQAFADGAEVLTPAQRAKIAERHAQRQAKMKQRMEHMQERMQKRMQERMAKPDAKPETK